MSSTLTAGSCSAAKDVSPMATTEMSRGTWSLRAAIARSAL
jgi:hypothetical protein